MKIVRQLSVAAALALTIPAGMSADGDTGVQLIGRVSSTAGGIPQVLASRGCHPEWLAQAMIDSNIPEARLWRLSPGQPIYLSTGLCQTTPPGGTAGYSRRLLQMRPAPAVQRRATSPPSELATLRERVSVLETENSGLKEKLTEAEKARLAAEERANSAQVVSVPAPVVRQTNWELFILSALAGVLLGLGVGYLLWGGEKLPTKITIKDNGKKFTYTLVEVIDDPSGSGRRVGRYQCPECPDLVIVRSKQDLHDHARRHPPAPIQVQRTP